MAGKATESGAIKLGMLAKRKQVAPVAGLDPSAEYCLVLSGIALPPNGNCYLARTIDRNHVRLIAYIDRNGHAFKTNKPLEAPPARIPDLALLHYEDDPSRGAIYRLDENGRQSPCGYYAERKGSFGYMERPASSSDELSVAPAQMLSGFMEYRDFFANAYLTYLIAPAQAAMPVELDAATASDGVVGPDAPSDLLVALKDHPLPDALGLIASRIDVNIATTPAQVSGFEHFARRILAESEFEKTRAIVASHDVKVVKLSTSGSFYLVFDSDIPKKDAEFLLGIETAINRIYRLQQALSAHSILGATEQRCAEIDAKLLGSIARRAEKLMAQAGDANPWMALEDGEARRGGEWDVRTRFADAIELLPFPLRMEYGFNCHVANGVFAVEFVLPQTSQMPRSMPSPAGAVAQSPQARMAMAREYALRLSVTLTAAAFASGISIELVSVTARHDSLTGPADFSLRFNRLEYLQNMPNLVKTVSEQPLTVPAAVQSLRARLQFEADKDGAVPWVRLTSDLLEHATRTADPKDDNRTLPPRLQERLNAHIARDLAPVASKDDPQFQRFEDAAGMEEDAPLLAIATLEELVTEYEVDHNVETARWCESAISRALLPLVEPTDAPPAPLPPSYFLALEHLTDLYEDNLKDHEKSLALAQRLIEIAPSVSRGYVSADHALVAGGGYQEASEMLIKALRFSTEPRDYVYLYYRLAFALWNTGRTSEAVACYMMVPEDHPSLGALAQKELAALMASIHMTEKPGRIDARNALVEAGIPVAPESSLISRLRGLAVELIDAGMFELALPLLVRSNSLQGADPIVTTARSLQ